MTPITAEISDEELGAVHDSQYDDWLDTERFVSWPFPITNDVRNPESQSLLDNKQKSAKIKPDLNNEQDALI